MKMLFAAVTLLAAVSLTIGAPECQWGPSYWCQSEEKAQKCGQLQYCQENIWKVKVEAPQDLECDACEAVVEFLDKELENDQTEAEAKAEVEKFCSVLGPLESICKTLIDSYFQDIWNYLVNKTSPDVICKDLGLCKSSQPKLPEKVKIDKCSICKDIVDFADEFIDSNKTEAEVLEELEKVCIYFGALADECKSFLNDYFPDMWKILMKETDPTKVCTELGLCTSATLKVKAVQQRPQSAIGCDVCKFVMEYFSKYLDKNATEAEAEKAALELCSHLGSLGAECTNLVNEFFPVIWDLLQQELAPDVICKQIGFCTGAELKLKDGCDACKDVCEFLQTFLDNNATEKEALEFLEKVCQYIPGVSQADCDKFLNTNFTKLWKEMQEEFDADKICYQLKVCGKSVARKPRPAAPKAGICDICKLVVNFLKVHVDTNKTEDEIQEALLAVCSLLEPSQAKECDALVIKYFDDIWKLVVDDELKNDEICFQLDLCKNSSVQARKPRPAAPKADFCAICELVVSFLKPFVDSNSTEEEAEDAMEKLCNFLPSGISTECLALVKEFFPVIWPLVKSEFDNDEICKFLGLCPKEVNWKVSAVKDELCDLCHMTVSYIKVIFDNSTDEEKAKNDFEELCGILPGNYKNECLSYVETYFDVIWDLADQEIDSGKLCQQIGLCPNTTVPVPMEVRSKVSAPKDELCDLCHLAVSYLKVIFDNSTDEATAKADLEQLCDLLPGNIKTECTALVENNFDKIWEGIEKEVDSGKLCQEIDLCPKTALPIPMVTRQLTAAKSQVAEPESILCTICEFVMEKIEGLLVNNATETEIIEVIEKVCDLFPKAEREYCDKFIEEYGKAIIKALVDGFGPKVVCTVIHLCIGDSETTFSFSTEPDSVECDVCIEVLTLVKATLGSNASKDDIEKVLNEVCSFFPKELVAECTAFVDEYIKEVVELIVQDIDPEKACEALKVCTKTSALASPWKMLEKAFSGKFN